MKGASQEGGGGREAALGRPPCWEHGLLGPPQLACALAPVSWYLQAPDACRQLCFRLLPCMPNQVQRAE